MRRALWLMSLMLALTTCGGIRTRLCGEADEPCCKSGPQCGDQLRCNDKSLCEACGGVGQACCAGSACSTGAVCDATNLCQPCGARAQACCDGATCGEALSCETGTCVEKVICGTLCTLGATRCSGTGGIDTCVAQGACPVWRATIALCPTNTTCVAQDSAADCVDPCPTRCNPNALLCTNTGLKRCVVPAGATCPSLVTEVDNSDNPQCVTGAVVSGDLVWESPTPLRTSYVAIAGDLASTFWTLDALGNVVRHASDVTEYEIIPTPSRAPAALTSCKLGSRLYAVGPHGSVYKRGFGAWAEENVGADVNLIAAQCDGNLAMALDDAASLWVRFGTSWSRVPTGFLGTPKALAWSFGTSEAWVAGTGGQVAHCTGFQSLAQTHCTIEAVGYNDTINALHADATSGQVMAVTDSGKALVRGGANGWLQVTDISATGRLLAINGYYEAGGSVPRFAIAGENSFSGVTTLPYFFPSNLAGVARLTLTGVMALDDDNTVMASYEGVLLRYGLNNLALKVRGGLSPISEGLNAIASAGRGRLFAVGDRGGRYTRENGAWVPDSTGVTVQDALTGVAAVSPNEVYAVGDQGQVLVRRFGQWAAEDVGHPEAGLHAVTFDANVITVVGTGGLWLEKNRATGVWRSLPHGFGPINLQALAIRKDTLGRSLETVAVGNNCTIISHVGNAFTRVPVANCTEGLNAATFTASGALYVAGDSGLMMQRTVTGFALEYPNVGFVSFSGLAADGETVYAVLRDGSVQRKAASWGPLAQRISDSALYGVTVDSDEGAFMVGAQGTVWRSP